MDLMEYMSKELFVIYGISVMKSATLDKHDAEALSKSKSELRGLKPPYVIKAQVQTGGRGKAGGVKFAKDREELLEACTKIIGMEIKGFTVEKVLVSEKLDLKTEWYLSITLDRLAKGPMIIFSSCGGMDIEEAAAKTPEKVLKVNIDPLVGINDYIPRYLLSKSGCGMQYFDQLYDLMGKLYTLFIKTDCTLVEINPLAVSIEDRIVALDAKVTVDDSALYRQPMIMAFRDSLKEDELVLEARKNNFLYIPCGKEGDIAVMSNGSGMIMSCMDLISKEGMKVGAALDLGGGATAERIKQAIHLILSNRDIKALVINIFGGITRCDEVASGIKMAVEEMRGCSSVNSGADGNGWQKLIIISFEGTNKEEGLEILDSISANGKIVPVTDIRQGIRELSARRTKS